MRQQTLLKLLGGFTLLLLMAFCSSHKNAMSNGKVLCISASEVAYIKGNILKLYVHKGHNVWQEVPNSTFEIPKGADDVIILGSKTLGVRFKRKLDTYKLQGAGRWVMDNNKYNKVNFVDDYDKAEGSDNAISVTKGNTMDLYLTGSPDDYPDGLVTQASFKIPKGTKYSFRSMGDGIFTSDGKTINFYVHDETGFTKKADVQIPVGADCKGLIPITYWTGYGYLKANSVDLFAFGRGSSAPYYKATFTFPN